jgi:hypothetical protein
VQKTHSTRGPQGETAYGFPTIHGSHTTQDEKRRIWLSSGAPGDNIGSVHNGIWENENLIPKANLLQTTYKNHMAARTLHGNSEKQND